ncbi:hypothetical protein VNI00_001286 [Paramarasmius palmivorus]|uniref:Uncharacterized protein n=1 Tax=Paramarasmius palmivorus TaxID=297713 RepID=A0AAW0E7Z8_9AGAR
MSIETILSSDSRMRYSDDPPWDSQDLGSTSQQGAQAALSFTGNSGIQITLHLSSPPDGHVGVNVQVFGKARQTSGDGKPPTINVTLSTGSCDLPTIQVALDSPHPEQTPLFDCVTLQSRNHTLELDVVQISPNCSFFLSRIVLAQPTTVILSPSSLDVPFTPTSPSSSANLESTPMVDTGVVVGVVVAAFIVLTLLAGILLHRKRILERARAPTVIPQIITRSPPRHTKLQRRPPTTSEYESSVTTLVGSDEMRNIPSDVATVASYHTGKPKTPMYW